MESYGRERVDRVVLANLHLKPQKIVDRIFEDIDVFRGATPLTDDQTAIALRVL
jgi:serine phosphatase RsbU (regulator of sigma subunit)